MAQAIQDERAAESGATATASAIVRDFRHDANITQAFYNPSAAVNQVANPLPNLLTSTATQYGPGYPVYLDYIGRSSYGGVGQNWVGGNQAIRISRPPLNAGIGLTERWFMMLDDDQFGNNGLLTGGGVREGKYTWAYMFRKPRLDQPLVELAVVVYKDRPTLATNLQAPEFPYSATFTANSKTVVLNYAGQVVPPLRPGDWLLDASLGANGIPNSYFYRVVDVTQNGNNTLTVDVTMPIRNMVTGNNAGTVVVLQGVIEVFEKGTGWAGQ